MAVEEKQWQGRPKAIGVLHTTDPLRPQKSTWVRQVRKVATANADSVAVTQPDHSPFLPLLRRGTSLLFMAVAVLAVVLLMAGKSTRSPAAPGEARLLTSMPLTATRVDAGSSAPLFSLKTMAPGHRYDRCIVIAANSAGAVVRFAVGDVSGTLTPWLRVEATTGTGTSRACADFVPEGTAFYTGSLGALNSAGAEGVPTGWVPASAERRTFRITLEVADDARAAGAQTVATLIWRLQEPKAMPITAPVESPPTAATPRATPSGKAPPAAPTPSSGSATPQAAVPAPGASMVPCTPTTSAQIGKLLAGIAPISGLALLLMLLVLLFLAVQDRVDRRDPKLAYAPLHGDPDQQFPHDGSTPWSTP